MSSMIATVEAAIMARLRLGLGQSVREIGSYRGQLDEDGINAVVNNLPALYVSFAGHKNPKARNTAGDVLYVPATFTVFVVTRNLSSEVAGRVGSAHAVGAYQLIEAVRRLMVWQDLGLPIERFTVGPVQLLGHIKVGVHGLTAYGCSFDTAWLDKLRGVEGLPLRDDPVFADLDGARSDDDPDLLRIGVGVDLGADGTVDSTDVVTLREVKK